LKSACRSLRPIASLAFLGIHSVNSAQEMGRQCNDLHRPREHNHSRYGVSMTPKGIPPRALADSMTIIMWIHSEMEA
jgi:hypothetical protein